MSSLRARIPRGRRRGRSPIAAGLLALVVLAIVLYLGFTKHVPFTHGFRVDAVFTSANSIRPNSPVRIAGVNVGKVTGVEGKPGTGMAVVKMELQDNGLPIHSDATMTIRSRIFLEGNYFVDLHPGSPEATDLSDGDTIPVTQTSTPVQLDEVLTALNSNTRTDLQDTLAGLGTALNAKPAAGSDATQDPAVRGLTGAQAINRGYDNAAPAERTTAIVNKALLGTEGGDLSKLIASSGRVFGALDSRERQLQDLVTNFNRTVGATAAESSNLRSAIRELGPTLSTANTTFDSLNAAFPPTRAFAREILPGVRESASTIDAAFPWVREVRGLLGPSELQGVARQLAPASASLARFQDVSLPLLSQIDLASRCATGVVLPTGDVGVRDGAHTVRGADGKPVASYKEFFYALSGIAGEGQNFDGNGTYVRFQPGGGGTTITEGRASVDTSVKDPKTGKFVPEYAYTNPAIPVQGTKPFFPGRQGRPLGGGRVLLPYKPNVPCYTNKRPDLNGFAARTGPSDSQAKGVAPGPPLTKTTSATAGGGR